MSQSGEDNTDAVTLADLEAKVAALEENQRKLLHWIAVLAMQDWVSFTVTHSKVEKTDPEFDKANPDFDVTPMISGNLKKTMNQLNQMLQREGIDLEVSDNVFF
ncbi:MAG: hypothetical protein L0G27_07800 [Paracoccus sp. (in: a-proteobacteria)]|nr:hypothetical protein [Paracoccus sp. (in: a-proteobacteria)]